MDAVGVVAGGQERGLPVVGLDGKALAVLRETVPDDPLHVLDLPRREGIDGAQVVTRVAEEAEVVDVLAAVEDVHALRRGRDRHGLAVVVRRALLRLPVERPLELHLQTQRHAQRQVVLVVDVDTLVVLAVPDDGLLLRVLLERLRGVRTEHPGSKVTDDGALLVLDGHRRVAEALRLEFDDYAIALARHPRLLRELEDLLALDLELVEVRGFQFRTER